MICRHQNLFLFIMNQTIFGITSRTFCENFQSHLLLLSYVNLLSIGVYVCVEEGPNFCENIIAINYCCLCHF